MNLKIHVPDKKIKDTLLVFEERFGLRATKAVVKRLLYIDLRLIGELASDDTYSRDLFWDAICIDLRINEWPRKKLSKAFIQNLKNKGYKLLEKNYE